MTDPNVLKALDCLWGAVDSLHDITCDLIDHRDARNEQVSKALCEAQDAISALMDEVEGQREGGKW